MRNPPTRTYVDNTNAVLYFKNILPEPMLQEYIDEACRVERPTVKSNLRRELCYSTDGTSYRYSGVTNKTVVYPKHVMDILPKLLEAVGDTKYTKLSHGVDIAYSDEFERGGSVSEHSDNEGNWGLVMVFSLGQSRWFRVKNEETGRRHNFLIEHNSLLCMHGDTFQKRFVHGLAKLHKDEERVGVRLSLNLRFESDT
jgi:alkylated DNA repair dioxygenase AlkB